MVLLHVCTKKEFPVEGKLRTLWHRVGIIRATGNGKMFLHLFQQPNTDFYLFDPEKDKDKELPTISYDETDHEDNGDDDE
jgi:hypothetical protein